MHGHLRNPRPVLAYEGCTRAPGGFWNPGNVSFIVGASLIISMLVAVPAMVFAPADASLPALAGRLTFFAVWLLGPVAGIVTGVLGLVRRTGRSALLGVAFNVLAWVLLAALCASLARG